MASKGHTPRVGGLHVVVVYGYAKSRVIVASSVGGYDTAMDEDPGFRDIKRKPKPGWERWRPPPPDRWARAGFRGKTVWDWLDLLIVPLMLALITIAFAWQQDARQNDIEDRRADAERKLAEQRAQDEALQAYLDQMSTLMLEKDLRESEVNSEVRTLARARTLTVLERLDPTRKTEVIRFLSEAELINAVTAGEGAQPIIDLTGANLSHTNLSDTNLNSAYLSKSDLSYANLRSAYLNAALDRADLRGADLRDAFVFDAQMPLADLRGADLSGADLSGANLAWADLSHANLSDTVLDGASLASAEGITGEELEQQAASLEDATMPSHQKYEDWLKDRGGSKND